MRRVLSAGVALPLLVLLVRYGEPVHFAALVAVAAAAGTWEVLRLVAFPGGRLTRAVGVAAGAALAVGGYLRPPLALALALWTV
ncbi:MAG: phosphatidate cytidylyltransferase, partial [Nitrospinota bacterium]